MKKKWILFFILIILTTELAFIAKEYIDNLPPIPMFSSIRLPKRAKGKLSLFILAGQSNMSGRGPIEQIKYDRNRRVYVFGNDYQWKLAREPIDDPTKQIDVVSLDLNAGVGPALAFADSLTQHDSDIIIGLIPCASGSSSVMDWQRDLSTNSLYGSCLKRINDASSYGNISGLLFFQGETDALNSGESPDNKVPSNHWGRLFTQYITDLRKDLSIPELPVVYAQLGINRNPEKYINWELVKSQQESVRLTYTAMIMTDDLPINDEIHFTTPSYYEIGERFAEAYLTLRGQNSP